MVQFLCDSVEPKKSKSVPLSRSIASDARAAMALLGECRSIIAALRKKKNAGWFLDPVTDAIIPGYSRVIMRPMDLQTLDQNNEAGKYTTLRAFAADARLIFSNAKLYNAARKTLPKKRNPYWDADTLDKVLAKQLSKAEGRLRSAPPPVRKHLAQQNLAPPPARKPQQRQQRARPSASAEHFFTDQRDAGKRPPTPPDLMSKLNSLLKFLVATAKKEEKKKKGYTLYGITSPVDVRQWPSYPEYVRLVDGTDQTMDLATMKSKIRRYADTAEFVRDALRVFANQVSFNFHATDDERLTRLGAQNCISEFWSKCCPLQAAVLEVCVFIYRYILNEFC